MSSVRRLVQKQRPFVRRNIPHAERVVKPRHIIFGIITPFIILSLVDGAMILIGLIAHRNVEQRRRRTHPSYGDMVREYGYQYREP